MDCYNIATIYILLGVAVYVDHLVYVHDVTKVSQRCFNETRDFTYFVLFVMFFPIVFYTMVKIRYDVAKEFKQWCEENGRNVK